jgi:hypothetical protein
MEVGKDGNSLDPAILRIHLNGRGKVGGMGILPLFYLINH